MEIFNPYWKYLTETFFIDTNCKGKCIMKTLTNNENYHSQKLEEREFRECCHFNEDQI